MLHPNRIYQRLLVQLQQVFDWQTERALSKNIFVKHSGENIFVMRNFGKTTRGRADTFSFKEPETLSWIDSFSFGETLLDIGANVGVYTLYAAKKGIEVKAIEPDALNFALLNLNIHDNHLNDHAIAFPFSIHSETKVSALNVGELRWGGTQSSFDRSVDWQGKTVEDGFKQGSSGISVDDFVSSTGFQPNHIKVDVDGNELMVLRGAKKTLNSEWCKSILIELYEPHAEYGACTKIIGEAGFLLSEKTCSEMYANETFHTENHIYVKQP